MHISNQRGIVVIKKEETTLLFDPKTITLFQAHSKKSLVKVLDEYFSFQKKQSLKKEKLSNSTSLMVFLLLSNDCNLRCQYCYASGGNYGKERGKMEKATLHQALHFILTQFPEVKNFSFSFFGGEPFLFPKLLSDAIALIKKMFRGKKILLGGPTNGTILPRSILPLLKKENYTVQISLDGVKKKHDLYRKGINNQGSYDLIKKNLSKFKSVNKELSFHSILSPANLDLLEIYSHAKKLKASFVSFSLAEIDSIPSFSFSFDDIQTIKENYTKLAEIYLKDLLKEKAPRIGNFTFYMKALHRRKRKNYFCAVGPGGIAISHTGDLYPCHRFSSQKEYYLGNVFGIFNRKAYDQMHSTRHIDHLKKCKKCFIRYVCGGGCFHEEQKMLSKHMVYEDSLPCEISRHIASLSFWLYAELLKHSINLHNVLYPLSQKLPK